MFVVGKWHLSRKDGDFIKIILYITLPKHVHRAKTRALDHDVALVIADLRVKRNKRETNRYCERCDNDYWVASEKSSSGYQRQLIPPLPLQPPFYCRPVISPVFVFFSQPAARVWPVVQQRSSTGHVRSMKYQLHRHMAHKRIKAVTAETNDKVL